MAFLASRAKLSWGINTDKLLEQCRNVRDSYHEKINSARFLMNSDTATVHDFIVENYEININLIQTNSISPIPMLKSALLIEEITRIVDLDLRDTAYLAFAYVLVYCASNLRFGPEVGLGKIKNDANVIENWWHKILEICNDIRATEGYSESYIIQGDSRNIETLIDRQLINVVITSPPYPNEKDYTRTTRLESIFLKLINSKDYLRKVKKTLVRSNTRGIYKDDQDDSVVDRLESVAEISERIEARRIALEKTSGFERNYHRVVKLYFGGMYRHLKSLSRVLKPGAKLAYVVGDQASYLQIMIPTGKILAEIAREIGYTVDGLDLFRTRFSTATQQHLNEEVLLLSWE